MLKKKTSILAGLLLTAVISCPALASSAKSVNGHYSAGYSTGGGYTYANTYADSYALQQIGIRLKGSGAQVSYKEKRGSGQLNATPYKGTNTYANYYVKGKYGTFYGSLK